MSSTETSSMVERTQGACERAAWGESRRGTEPHGGLTRWDLVSGATQSAAHGDPMPP